MDDNQRKQSIQDTEAEIRQQEKDFGEQEVEEIYEEGGLDALHGEDDEHDDYMMPVDHKHATEDTQDADVPEEIK